MQTQTAPPPSFAYSKWRHGGWYVPAVRYPSGAIGCVYRDTDTGRWHIACDSRPDHARADYKTRDDAARAEWIIASAAGSN